MKEEVDSYKELREAMKKLGLAYEYAENLQQLRKTLIDSLLRSYFRVQPGFGSARVPPPDVSRRITQTGYPPDWAPVSSYPYKVRVPSIRNLYKNIKIDPGDVMLFDLVKNEDNGHVQLKQSMYADSSLLHIDHGPDHIRKAERQKDWLLAVIQNQPAKTDDTAQLLATLQKEVNIPRQEIRQLRPQWIWYEIPAARVGDVPRLRISPLSGYPAPAWGLDVEPWRREEPIKLNTWWGDLPAAHGRLPLNSGLQRSSFRWQIDKPPVSVLVESLDVEEQEMNVEEDIRDVERKPKKSKKFCLVVRLSYSVGQGPYFVHWPGWEFGAEHRFYIEAGKYTGLFWSTETDWSTRASILKWLKERQDEQLHIYSVAELKKDANILHPKELDLGLPNEKWRRPKPVPTVRHALPN